jgi:hypothetical protein
LSDQEKKYVVCYDLEFSEYLQSLGHKRIKRFEHHETKKLFDIYLYTPEFNKYLSKGELKNDR